MIRDRRARAASPHRSRAALAWRWLLVGVAVLGAVLFYLGDLWAGIALWVAAVVAWQVCQAVGLWRSFGLGQRLRAARRDHGRR